MKRLVERLLVLLGLTGHLPLTLLLQTDIEISVTEILGRIFICLGKGERWRVGHKVLDPNKISGVGTCSGTNFGLLVHVLPGPNKQRAFKPNILLSLIRKRNNLPGRLVRSRYSFYKFTIL